jgi:electron transport complex protein RnfG
MATEAPRPLKALGAVAAVGLVAATIVAGSYELSRDRIANNERSRQLATLQESAGLIGMDVAPTAVSVPLPDGSADDPTELFALFAEGASEPVLVFAITAPDGYNGEIGMLVAVTPQGTVAGVRVVSHRETPGLGDAIDRAKSNWIEQFVGTSLSDPRKWAVKKDGGTFDSLTGATVTPRAVVRAVHRVLDFYERHAEALLGEAIRGREQADE